MIRALHRIFQFSILIGLRRFINHLLTYLLNCVLAVFNGAFDTTHQQTDEQ